MDGVTALARALVGSGRRPGDRVAILAADHAVVVTALLGVVEAGCVFVPLDPNVGVERLARLIATVGCATVIVDGPSRPRIPGGLSRSLAILELDGTELVGKVGPRSAPPVTVDRDAPSSIYFTSGSTGAPRAILGRLAGIDHHIAWELDYLGLDASVRGAIVHATIYDAYLPDVLVPLCAGGVACAPATRDVVLDPKALCAWIEREQISLLHCVPSLFRALLACAEAHRLGSLRHVLLAGEIVRPADVRAARAVLGDRVRLVNLYGPTEATFVKLHHEITDADLERPVPIGLPMPAVTVHVLDDRGQPCPPGEVGQIAIQSAYGSHGYLDEPDLTQQKFLPAPDGSAEQLYLTGDYGSQLPDGRLAFHGRRDRQIKLWGARVDLDEVEALVAGCEGVLEAVVVPTEDHIALLGYVVLAADARIAEVRKRAIARLTPAMRLARLTSVAALPRTPSGKIDRQRLNEVT